MLDSSDELRQHYTMQPIGICGLGLIGRQRLNALNQLGWNSTNLFVLDPNLPIVNNSSFTVVESLELLIDRGVKAAIVATPHDISTKIASRLLDCGIEVLLEKPMGRSLTEARLLHSHPYAKNLSVGFNYRFMSSVHEAKQIVDSKVLGKIHTIRMDLGHGGSPNDKSSWKLDPQTAGGGVILDPGIHLLDLIFYIFSYDFAEVRFSGANSWSGFWKTGIEEAVNAVGTASGANLNFSVSVVAWKTRFEIEIIGTDGYLKLSGRGRSDGPQIITKGERWGWMGGQSQIESETSKTVSMTDDSLAKEVEAWLIKDHRVGSADDGLRAELLRNQILDLIQE